MQVREFEGKKVVNCRDIQENIHKLLMDLDELMEELKVLDIPETKRRVRTSMFRDVMSTIFKLNGLDYEIHKHLTVMKLSGSRAGVVVNNGMKQAIKEALDVVTRADEFLAEYR